MKSTEVEFYCKKGKFMVIENNRFVLRLKLKTKVSVIVNLRFYKMIKDIKEISYINQSLILTLRDNE